MGIRVNILASAFRRVPTPGEAHNHGNNDSDLDGSYDGCNKDVVQLLTTRDNIEDVEVLDFLTLEASIAWLTPGGHTQLDTPTQRQQVNSLTYSVNDRNGKQACHRPIIQSYRQVGRFCIISQWPCSQNRA